LALVFIAQKQPDAAQQLLDQALPVDAPLQSKSQRLIGCARAELCLVRADPAGALAWVDRLLRTAVLPTVADGQVGALVIPRLWQLRGEALLAQCRWEEAEAVLLTALTPEPNAPVGTPLRLSAANFGRIPRVYIETLQDQGVTPGLQKQMYTATSCQQVLSLNTSHSPFLSAPQSLVEHLLTAAQVTASLTPVRIGR
jgi:hypothetical protein